MSLEFGVFDHLDRNARPLRDFYEDRLQVVEAFERAGFYGYHVAEHHFTPLGMAPSPSVFLSAIAQRTTTLRFGTFVYALPLHHPLRLMEEICMLDHLSGGRIEIGFGRGSVPYEVTYYAQSADERQQIYAERLELLLKAFTSKVLDWEGRYDRFVGVPIEIEPLQKPHPPLWYGAHSPDSAERAARKGLNVVCNDAPGLTRASLERYRQVWRELHEAKPFPKMGMVRFIVVADTDAAAERLAERAYPVWLTSFNHLHRTHGTMPQFSRPETFKGVTDKGLGVAGSPETVRRFLSAQVADCQANYVVGQFAFGDLTLDEMTHSIALFGDHVIPALRQEREAAAVRVSA